MHRDQANVMENIKAEQTIYILEISMCGDLYYESHFKHKQEQHKQLQEELTAAGWKKVILLDPILFGIGGSLFSKTSHIITTQLKIPPHHVRTALTRIQHKAAHRACDIVRAGREHDRPKGLGPLPPALQRGRKYG